jgi:hypothetical protein
MGRRRVASSLAGVEKSRVGGGLAGVVNSRGGAKRDAVRRRAIGDGTADVGRSRIGGSIAGMGKSRVEDGVRQSAAQRHGVGGGVVEEEVWLHRKSSHGGEDRGDGGQLGVGRRLGLRRRRRRSGSDRMCLG